MIAAALSLVLAAPPGLPGEADLLGSARYAFALRIDALAATPDGDRVAVSAGPEVTLVAARTGARLARFQAPCNPIDSLAWTPDGAMLVGGCNNRNLGGARVFAWRMGQPQPAFSGGTQAPVTAIAVVPRPEGAAIVAGEATGHLSAWAVEGGASLGRVDAGVGRIERLAAAPGRVAAIGAAGVALAAVAGPAQRVYASPVDAAAWTPTGTLVLASAEGVRLLSPGSPQHLRFVAPPPGAGPARAVAIQGQRTLVAWAGAGVYALQGDGLSEQARLPFAAGGAVVFSADAGLVVSTGAQRDVLSVHDLRAGAPITQGHRAAVTQFAVSPAGDQVATIDFDGEVMLWRLADGVVEARWRVAPPEAWLFAPDTALVAFLGNGELIAGSGSGGVFQLSRRGGARERAERRYVTQAKLDAHGNRGAFILRGGDAEVRQLGPRGDRQLWTLNKKIKRAGQARRVDISADGKLVLAVASQVFVLDATTAAVRWRGAGQDAALSADGRVLAVLDAGEITVRALPGGAVLRSFPAEGASALALDADGTRVAYAAADGLYVAAGHHAERLGPQRFPRAVESLSFAGAHLVAHPHDAPYLHRVALDRAPAALHAPTTMIAAGGPPPPPAFAPAPATAVVAAADGLDAADEDAPADEGLGEAAPVDDLADLVAKRAAY